MRRVSWGWAAVAAVPALFIGWFFAYPTARILGLGLSGLGAGLGAGAGLDGRLLGVAWFTLWQAAASTALTLVAAAPLTWAVSNFEFRGRRLVTALVTVPFVLPTVVVGTAFASLGAKGSVAAILAAHVFFNVAVVVRTVSTLWRRIDPSLHDAGRVLGASEREVLRTVTLPLLKPAIAAASSIVFLFTFTSFGTVLILGGYRYATLEVEIHRQAVALFNLPLAASLAVLQLVGVSAALYAYSRYQERRTASWALDRDSAKPRPQGGQRWAVAASTAVTVGALAAPLVALTARSLRGGAFARLFKTDPVVGAPVSAVGASLVFALAAAAIAVVVGVMAATVVARRSGGLSRWFDLALMLPLGTSAVTIGFGLIIALDWPVDLRASAWLIPIAHALVAVPFVVRAVVPTLHSIPADTREAASVLGASPGRVWRRVDLPIASRAVMVGAGFAAAVSLGEFGATSFVARPATPTIPTMIFRLLGRPGQASFGTATALAVVLAALTAGIVMWLDRAEVGDLGRF